MISASYKLLAGWHEVYMLCYTTRKLYMFCIRLGKPVPLEAHVFYERVRVFLERENLSWGRMGEIGFTMKWRWVYRKRQNLAPGYLYCIRKSVHVLHAQMPGKKDRKKWDEIAQISNLLRHTDSSTNSHFKYSFYISHHSISNTGPEGNSISFFIESLLNPLI